MNLLNHGYGEISSCLAWDCHIRSRAIAIEVVVFVFRSVGLLVGTLSGRCLVYQLALQFVFGSRPGKSDPNRTTRTEQPEIRPEPT